MKVPFESRHVAVNQTLRNEGKLRRKQMNRKRFLVLGIALILTAMIVGVAFADNDEYEYTVTVYYNVVNNITKKTELKSVTYTFWAASAAEAQQVATARCEREYGQVASCGGAIATGRKR
jgi:hypothetical protein